MAPTESRSPRSLRRRVNGRAYLVALVASCVAGVAAISFAKSAPGMDAAGGARDEVVVASGADRYPNSTAADWTTYADHVVVGSVVSERRLPPTTVEVERGEGLIVRRLSISVERVLWSAPGLKSSAPSSFDWPALGWKFNTDPTYEETLMTGEHQPRLELGGTYVFALDRPSQYCSNTPSGAPQWRGLGASSILPISRGIIGAGEFESRKVTPQEAKLEWAEVGADLPASVAGEDLTALASALSRAVHDPVERSAARAEKCTRLAAD